MRGVMFIGRSLRRRLGADARGEALPVVILFLGVLLTILLGIHVVIVALARTAVQSAADAGVAAAQTAPAAEREAEGVLAARIAMAGARSSVIETELPVVIVEPDRGLVTAVAHGGVISPLLGGMAFTAQACGPLDDLPASQLTSGDAWRC